MQRLSKYRPANTTVILQELEKIKTTLYPPTITPKPTVIQTPPKVTPKPTVIQTPPKVIPKPTVIQTPLNKRNNKPSKKVQIPWTRLTGVVMIYGMMGAFSLMIGIPWWGWTSVIAMTVAMSEYMSGAIAWPWFIALVVATIAWCGSVASVAMTLAGVWVGVAAVVAVSGVWTASSAEGKLYRDFDFSKLHRVLIMTATSFGGLGLGILMVRLWQYLM